MSEITTSKCGRSEITVRNLRTREVRILTGRFGTFSEACEHARKHGYALLTYKAV